MRAVKERGLVPKFMEPSHSAYLIALVLNAVKLWTIQYAFQQGTSPKPMVTVVPPGKPQ